VFKTNVYICLILACVIHTACQSSETSHKAKAGTIEQKTIRFASGDSLQITADLSVTNDLTAPFIVLFHQAGWSRGEYGEISPKLNGLGFNTLAVDLRSGGTVNGVDNETHQRAAAANKPTGYLDAYADMVAALRFVHERYAKGKLIAWGSSYSAALVIRLAADYPDLVDGVLAFAPGEYFARFGMGDTYITEAGKHVTCPVFITSAKREQQNWQAIFDAIPSKQKGAFVPETEGNHGSRALWERFDDSEPYWQAVSTFLIGSFLNE